MSVQYHNTFNNIWTFEQSLYTSHSEVSVSDLSFEVNTKALICHTTGFLCFMDAGEHEGTYYHLIMHIPTHSLQSFLKEH